MTESDQDHVDALAEAERRIFEHPGYLKYNDQRAFQRSINAVFTANGSRVAGGNLTPRLSQNRT